MHILYLEPCCLIVTAQLTWPRGLLYTVGLWSRSISLRIVVAHRRIVLYLVQDRSKPNYAKPRSARLIPSSLPLSATPCRRHAVMGYGTMAKRLHLIKSTAQRVCQRFRPESSGDLRSRRRKRKLSPAEECRICRRVDADPFVRNFALYRYGILHLSCCMLVRGITAAFNIFVAPHE